MQLLGSEVLEVGMHRTEYLSNGTGTQGTLTEHIFLTRIGLKLHARQTGRFLATVMLFLHQQIELVQPIHPRAIFFLIVLQRFQQADHRYTAFVFKWFHISIYSLN